MADEPNAPAPEPGAPTTPAAKAPAAPPVPPRPAGEAKPAPVAKPAAPAPPPRPRTETEDVRAVLDKFPGVLTHVEDTDPRIPTLMLGQPPQLLPLARFLLEERQFEHLALITSVDYKTHLEVVYNFWSYSRNVPLEVKVRLDPKDPKLPSLTSLWAGANWHERENYDLMGVVFEGHPDLRRILLPPGWKGHPLRKDYEWKKEQYVGLDPVTGEDLVFPEPREGAW